MWEVRSFLWQGRLLPNIWFPFKSQEVSSINLLGSCPISQWATVGLMTYLTFFIAIFDSTASLRIPDHWIYAACHVLCGVCPVADASVSGKCGSTTLEWIVCGLTPHLPVVED
jgi:hypothetical protein